MTIHSPSSTVAFMENPLVWWLYRVEGWVPRLVTRREVGLIAGGGFAAGMAAYYKGAIIEDALEITKLELVTRLAEYANQPWHDDVADLQETLPAMVCRAVGKYIEKDPLGEDMKVLGVEIYREDYDCKMDLELDTPLGLAFLDFKFSLRMDYKYVEQRLAETAYSWQFMHYAWAISQVYDRPCTQAYVCLVVADPFKIHLRPYPVSDELVALWYTSADSVWRVMDGVLAGTYKPWCPFKFYGRFGKDAYAEAVLSHRLHPHLMTSDYVQRGKETL